MFKDSFQLNLISELSLLEFKKKFKESVDDSSPVLLTQKKFDNLKAMVGVIKDNHGILRKHDFSKNRNIPEYKFSLEAFGERTQITGEIEVSRNYKIFFIFWVVVISIMGGFLLIHAIQDDMGLLDPKTNAGNQLVAYILIPGMIVFGVFMKKYIRSQIENDMAELEYFLLNEFKAEILNLPNKVMKAF